MTASNFLYFYLFFSGLGLGCAIIYYFYSQIKSDFDKEFNVNISNDTHFAPFT